VPRQHCLEDPDFEVPFLDFSGAEDPQAASLAWIQQRFVEPYVLDGGLLFSFALLKLAENRYRWFGKFHHLVTDGWGTSLTAQKVAAEYNRLLSGNDDEAQAHSYVDFIERDQQYLNSSRYADDREYWSAKYRQLPEPLFAPRAGSEVCRDSPFARRRTLRLGHDLYRQLEVLAESQDATTFHVFLAALGCYFSRVSNSTEVTVGLPLLT
jgi:arthrofactin-type cyclic lipopeptide synthetase A